VHFSIAQVIEVRGEKKIDRIPADGPGKVTLQGSGKLDHVG
jgi:hypothetical protein